MKTIKEWEELLKNQDASCYIKPTKRVHESGYGIFECGYIITKNGKCKEKLVLGKISDSITSMDVDDYKMKLDLTKDGYIRILAVGLKWSEVYSGAYLERIK